MPPLGQLRHRRGSAVLDRFRWTRFGSLRPANTMLSKSIPSPRPVQEMTPDVFHDKLTGLPNRLLMTIRLEQALAQAQQYGRSVGLLFIDIDRFKGINDAFGEEVGDQVLLATAQRVKQCVREQDTVVRTGGDTFAVILNELPDTQDAVLLAGKILRTIAEPVTFPGSQFVASASIGISVYPGDAQTWKELASAADLAVCHAKNCGGNAFAQYTAQLAAKAGGDQTLPFELAQALPNGQLMVYYQPRIESRSGRLVGVEATIRWQHPTRGLLLPASFLPIAETGDLIETLGSWVLRQALAQVSDWAAQGLTQLQVAVNLSERQIQSGSIVDTVASALRAHATADFRVQLEFNLPAGARLADKGSADTLRRLRELGVRIACDDFGTGYSSLAHLKHHPIDTLTLARALVEPLPTDAGAGVIVVATIDLGKRLGLRLVGKGVQNRDQLVVLRDQGCDEVQGPLVGEAMGAAQMTQFLRSNRSPSADSWLGTDR